MPYYKIGRSYGYAGTSSEDYIQADTLEDAQEEAWEQAVQRVDSWAEEVTEEEYNKNA